MIKEGVIPVRGFLIHITHYDPAWCKVKSREKPFDLDLGLEIVDTMSEAGLNLLVIDCADGVGEGLEELSLKQFEAVMKLPGI